MYKLLSKVLVLLLVITYSASPIPAFSMEQNLAGLYVNTVAASGIKYLASGEVSTTTTVATTPTATGIATDDHGNSFDTATEIKDGDEIQAVMERKGDLEFFKFVPITSGMYCFESTGSINAGCELFKDSKSIKIIGVGSGDSFYFPIWLEASQVYYLRTWTSTKDVSYGVKVYSVEDDHGYDTNSATTLSVGDEISGEINFSNDTDYFKITTDDDGQYLIESSGTTNVIGYMDDDTSGEVSDDGVNFWIAYTFKANRIYYLKVVHKKYGNKDYQNTGAYKIKLTKLNDDFGDSLEKATLVDTQKVINGIQASNDSDYVKFVPSETSSYTIEKFGKLMMSTLVYDENYTGLTSKYVSGGDTGFIKNVYNLEAGKTYYLYMYCPTSSCGDYQFVIYPGIEGDRYSRYFYYSDLQIGDQTSGTFNYYGDADYYRIYADSSYVYEITCSGKDACYEVYSSSEYKLLPTENIVDDDNNLRTTVKFGGAVYYYIKVYHKDSVSGLGDYTLKVMTVDGDINGDGSFNSIDFGYVRMYLLGLKSELRYKQLKVGDVDNSGSINSIDFGLMRQVLLGIKNSFD